MGFNSESIMTKPYTHEEMLAMSPGNPDIFVRGIIIMDFCTLFSADNNFDDNLYEISNSLTGTYYLEDISYKMVGCDPEKDFIYVEVCGYIHRENLEEVEGKITWFRKVTIS